MNSLLLFSLIDPRLVKSRFKPDQGLIRISRIYKASLIAAARKGMEAPYDTFLELVAGRLWVNRTPYT